MTLANVDGVIDPPEGFVLWATEEMGAVSVESDAEWEELKRQARDEQ